MSLNKSDINQAMYIESFQDKENLLRVKVGEDRIIFKENFSVLRTSPLIDNAYLIYGENL